MNFSIILLFSFQSCCNLRLGRIIYFYLCSGLLIHIHQCHLLSPSHKCHIKGLMVPCILGLCVLVSAVSSAWKIFGSHLLWHTPTGQFQCPAQTRHFVEKQLFGAPQSHLYFQPLSPPSNYISLIPSTSSPPFPY